MTTPPKHQSAVAKDRAQAVIDAKILLLRTWLETGIPCRCDADGNILLDPRSGNRVLEYFPRTLRQFKLWDGSQNSTLIRASGCALGRTGNDTLAKRPSCASLATQLMSALVEVARKQGASNHESSVARLKVEIAAMKRSVEIRCMELFEQQRTIRTLERRISLLIARQQADAEETQRTIGRLSEELAAERNKSAELARSLSRITPLHRATRGA